MAKKSGEGVVAGADVQPAPETETSVVALVKPEAASGPKAEGATVKTETKNLPGPAEVKSLPAPETTSAAGPTAGFVKAQEIARTNMEKAVKTAEELVAFGQGNLEAFMKSSQIWAAGVQDISKSVAASAQAQIDQTMAAVKALATVKSFKEAVDLQTNLARSAVEKAVTETGKLTDASVKLAEQTWAPITARVTLAVEKFGRPV